MVHVDEGLEIHLRNLEGGGDGLDIEPVLGHPAGLQGMPLGDLDAAQLGGRFDGQIKTSAAALDKAGQGGGGLEAGAVSEGVGLHMYSCTHYRCEVKPHRPNLPLWTLKPDEYLLIPLSTGYSTG